MIPLRDTTKSPGFPYVNIILIVVNVLIFLYGYSIGEYVNVFIFRYGLIPANVFSASPDTDLTDRIYPFLTSMFLHGGGAPPVGKQLFLYLFGDNVERRV